jgi:hypothetical protein
MDGRADGERAGDDAVATGSSAKQAVLQSLSAEDTAAIERVIAKARVAREQAEVQRSKQIKKIDNDDRRLEWVVVEAPSTEQLDPVYSALSEGSRIFPPDSPAAIAYRKRADEFAADLLRSPMKLVMKDLNKSKGELSFQMTLFDRSAVFSEEKDGSVKFSSGSAESSKTDHSAVGYLFPDWPQAR